MIVLGERNYPDLVNGDENIFANPKGRTPALKPAKSAESRSVMTEGVVARGKLRPQRLKSATDARVIVRFWRYSARLGQVTTDAEPTTNVDQTKTTRCRIEEPIIQASW